MRIKLRSHCKYLDEHKLRLEKLENPPKEITIKKELDPKSAAIVDRVLADCKRRREEGK